MKDYEFKVTIRVNDASSKVLTADVMEMVKFGMAYDDTFVEAFVEDYEASLER